MTPPFTIVTREEMPGRNMDEKKNERGGRRMKLI